MQTLDMATTTLQEQCLRAVIYGPAGSGKTTFLKTLPKPLLVFDFDQKFEPLIGTPGIEVISYVCNTPEEATKVFNQFKRDWREVIRDPKWKSLALDSLTSFDTINLRHFVMLGGKGADAVPTLPTYGEQSSYYSFFFTELKAIRDKHVVVTAHELYNIDEESGVHSIQPLITGRTILAKLPSLFKEIWYLKKKGGTTDDNTLYYRPIAKAIATSLILHGTGAIENPTFDKLVTQQKGKV